MSYLGGRIPAMDIDAFWDIIEAARAHIGPGRPFDEVLTSRLASLTRQDILAYQERFDQVHAAVYRWDLWAAAYLIGGGCSDDSFIDFRAGLIAQGRQWYQKAVASPDSLADHPAVTGTPGGSADIPLFMSSSTTQHLAPLGNRAARRGFMPHGRASGARATGPATRLRTWVRTSISTIRNRCAAASPAWPLFS